MWITARSQQLHMICNDQCDCVTLIIMVMCLNKCILGVYIYIYIYIYMTILELELTINSKIEICLEFGIWIDEFGIDHVHKNYLFNFSFAK